MLTQRVFQEAVFGTCGAGPSSFFYLAVLLVVGGLFGCGADKQSEKDKVIAWLEKDRFGDRDNRFKDAPSSSLTYEEWLAEGARMERVETILCELLRTQEEEVDLAQVACALGYLGDRTSVPVLVTVLDSIDSSLRVEAAASLGRLKDPSALAALGERALRDPDLNVRANAVVAIGEIGGPQAEAYLKASLEDEEEFVVSLAREALGCSRTEGSD
jgi:HEAT repeat protein